MNVTWSRSATRDLRAIDQATAQRIRDAVRHFVETGQGNITKLTGRHDEWRLRVGVWRVLFTYDAEGIFIDRVRHRREAYRD